MRGLSRHSGGALTAGTTALAGLSALGLLMAGCSTGGTGTRDEGVAPKSDKVAATPSPSATSPAPFTKVDPVKLLKADPKVSPRVKAQLKPCTKDEYPIDVTYGHLTGTTGQDVIVNVMNCADAVGLGAYVYRASGSSYDNVFTAEETPVYAEIDRGDLVVTRQMYAAGDKPAFASSEVVTTYRWSGGASGRFAQQDQVENDYSRAVAGNESAAPVPATP
ncbi:hypothetical protein [Streptomyces violascens]|uniref:Lipoprotein CseA n=1 Tax=Streptomyces violascens TaxID=67381 RepID=A0ABQ3QQX7_9ACTN|nr:hypothetical protein [Streptomyces violascens]GGU46365.1 lipoprotein CseA [Streptomyces violascens]GHI39689.1 lipoprotein CseA [Streptomyces violascens]